MCYYKAKEQLRKVHGVYSYFKFFWNWDNFFHYLIATIFIMVFIFSFARVTSAIPTIVELFGFFALAVEVCRCPSDTLCSHCTHTALTLCSHCTLHTLSSVVCHCLLFIFIYFHLFSVCPLLS